MLEHARKIMDKGEYDKIYKDIKKIKFSKWSKDMKKFA